MTGTPSRAKRFRQKLLPVAIPPVRATRSISGTGARLGGRHRVLQQHRDREGADTAGNGCQRACDFDHIRVHVADHERSSPFEAAAASELERRIERALATMPAASREVLLLVGVAGLDHSDAADVCGLTPEALRQRLHRARETLSRALEQEDAVGSASALQRVPS